MTPTVCPDALRFLKAEIETAIGRYSTIVAVSHLGGVDFIAQASGLSPFRMAVEVEEAVGRIELRPAPGNHSMVRSGPNQWNQCGAWRTHVYSYICFSIPGAYHKLHRERPVPLPESSAGYVYFIGCGDKVKIGRARDPRARMSDLQRSNPERLTLLALVPDGSKEPEFHRRFWRLRVTREWFRFEGELRELIGQLAGGSE